MVIFRFANFFTASEALRSGRLAARTSPARLGHAPPPTTSSLGFVGNSPSSLLPLYPERARLGSLTGSVPSIQPVIRSAETFGAVPSTLWSAHRMIR